MTDIWTPSATSYPRTVQALLPQPEGQDFAYFAQAAIEADEFGREAKTSINSPNLPLELGDIAFFLMATSHTVSLSSRPEIWLAELGIPTATPTRWDDLSRLSEEQAVCAAVSNLSAAVGRNAGEMFANRRAVFAGVGFVFEVAIRYALARGWDLLGIAEATRLKNEFNYPDLFFTWQHAPWFNAVHSINCLRLFRRITAAGESILARWHREYAGRTSWVTHERIDPLAFRQWVLRALREVGENDTLGDRLLAESLIAKGNWTAEQFPEAIKS